MLSTFPPSYVEHCQMLSALLLLILLLLLLLLILLLLTAIGLSPCGSGYFTYTQI